MFSSAVINTTGIGFRPQGACSELRPARGPRYLPRGAKVPARLQPHCTHSNSVAVTSHERLSETGGKAALSEGVWKGRYGSAAQADGRKCSLDFVRRAPRDAECKVLGGHRRQPGVARRDEHMVSDGRNRRPVFRLGGRREARPGSEKPVKAEPMKDEIRL